MHIAKKTTVLLLTSLAIVSTGVFVFAASPIVSTLQQNKPAPGIAAVSVFVKDPTDPAKIQSVLGAEVDVITFQVLAPSNEDMIISKIQIPLNYYNNKGMLGLVTEARLLDGDTLLGVSQPQSAGKYVATVFNGLKVNVPKNSSKKFTLKLKISSETVYSGVSVNAVLLDKADGKTPVLTAVGATTGKQLAIIGTSKNILTSPKGGQFTFFGVRPALWPSFNSPTGAVNKGFGQVVSRVVITAAPGAQGTPLLVERVAPTITTTIPFNKQAKRIARFYKSELLTAANKIAEVDISSLDCTFNNKPCTIPFQLKSPMAIEGGTSYVFVMTLDTVDAVANSVLSVSYPSNGGLWWNDGIVGTQRTFMTDPPVKTLMY